MLIPTRLRLICTILACLTAMPLVLPAIDTARLASASDDHGHGSAIGHNLPKDSEGHEVDRAAYEGPAWFQADLAIWSFAVFLVLLVLLSVFAWKPIMQGLEKREEGIARQIAETKASNEEAKRMLASYERRLAEASDEVRGMLEEARRDAESTKQAIVAEARKAAEDERNRAMHDIQLAKDDALTQIAEKAGRLAVDIAGKFLRDKIGADDQARLVRDSVASLSSRPSIN